MPDLQPESSITGWIMAGIATMVASLSSAIAFLYRVIQSNHTERLNLQQEEIRQMRDDIKRLDQLNEECLEDRARLSVEVKFLKAKLGTEGNSDGT